MHNGEQTRRVCPFDSPRDAHEATSAAYMLKKVGEEDAALICCSLLPFRRPHDPALSSTPTTCVVIRARSPPQGRFGFGFGLGFFTHITWRRPRFCAVWEHRQRIRPEFTQLLLQPTTEGRTYARMDAAGARPRLFSPLSLRLPPAPGKDTGAPSSAAVSSGHLPPRGSRYQARSGRSPPLSLPPLQFDAERLTLPLPDNKMKPYGAPSAERRGESRAGAPLLKGQEPDSRAGARLAWIR